MVLRVPKPQDKVRICVDLTQLNKSVRREHHQLPAVEQTLAQLAGAKLLSKLDFFKNLNFKKGSRDRSSV